jgi:inosine-uridine nucleoside N-ribohydrolase
VRPIILDCDPGHDDVVALLLALASDEVELLGVTTVAGNQTIEKTTSNALRVLEYVGRPDVPVVPGADRPLLRDLQVAADWHGESGLGEVELPVASREPAQGHAADWIARRLRDSAEPVTIVATGPLTNIALVLSRYPSLQADIDAVVVMGGAIGLGNVTPAAEFNFWTDPEAAQRVLSSGSAVAMVGLDVTHRALLTRAELDALARSGRAGALVADLYSFYGLAYERRYGWGGTPVHDAVALAHVIDPTLLRMERRAVLIDTGPEPSRGRSYVDRWNVTGRPPNCDVAVEIDVERFLVLLAERIATLG